MIMPDRCSGRHWNGFEGCVAEKAEIDLSIQHRRDDDRLQQLAGRIQFGIFVFRVVMSIALVIAA